MSDAAVDSVAERISLDLPAPEVTRVVGPDISNNMFHSRMFSDVPDAIRQWRLEPLYFRPIKGKEEEQQRKEAEQDSIDLASEAITRIPSART